MAFNFGGAPNPAPAPGGFSFGSTAPQPAAPAATNAPAPFSFGGTTPAPSTTPAPAGGGFSFGGGATAPTPAAPPSTGFSFTGATPAAGTPAAPGPAPAFTFGSTAANTPAPGAFGAPPASGAPTTAPAGGFSFGGTPAAPATTAPGATPAAPAPGTNAFSTTTPAPGGAFSFGGGGTTPAATPGAFSFGGAPSPGNALGATATNPTAPQDAGLEVPSMSTTFPNEKVFDEISMLLSASESALEDGREAASELVDRLQCNNTDPNALGQMLSKPTTLTYQTADVNIRNQLQRNPSVVLPGKREATLVPDMLREVIRISDDLRISEKEALCLFAEVSNDERRLGLEDQLGGESFISKSLAAYDDDYYDGNKPIKPLVLGNNVVKAAKELYFLERGRQSQLLLLLAQSRLQAADQPWGDLIVQATDSLLQNNLIDNLVKVIREWTLIIGRIEVQLSLGRDSSTHSFSGFAKEKPKKKHFDMVHLQFAIQERQTAAETLFYLAYHAQFTATEVAALIDVIKDLTNGLESDKGLPMLDPFRDVPSSYENPPQEDQPWAPYQPNPGPLKEKQFLEWEKELVKKTCQTTLPDLLRCVSALLMTVISALDTKQTLVDRQTHRANAFGVGNKLLPPGETSTSGLDPIHQRLTSDGCRNWKRTDICGLLSASYAMLLRSSPVLLSSPRAGSSSPSRARMRVFQFCITAPMVLNSVTFARLCLLPALQRPSRVSSSNCDTSEFLLAVLADYVSSFLETLSASGNLPVSRRTWKREQEEGLQLKRDNQKQRREFMAWSGSRDDGTEEPVPTSVDLITRPDCMDDLAALAIAIASLGSDFAREFWALSVDATSGVHQLAPNRTLMQLKALAARDDSLQPFYVAFLAALSGATNPGLAESGAWKVYTLLADTNETPANWSMVLGTLRWYFRQYDSSGSRAASSSGSSVPPSSNYYYQRVMQQQQQPSSSQSNKPFQELGEDNIFYLLGLLGLIANVASVSAKARLEILSLKLPIQHENTGAILGTDATLNVLFALSVAPLPPEVRGATLDAISKLICMDGLTEEDDKAKMIKYATSAWELLDGWHHLPVSLLDQYPRPMSAQLNRGSSGLRFPASSKSLAGNEASNKSSIPVDEAYAILYEMEHVESAKGRYSSTEGFLRLLSALFSCCSPSDLGKHWRVRTGCSPYVEYIVHYVLPRATGTGKMGKLPFRSKADQVRLLCLALEVIETILVRYPVPVAGLDKQGLTISSSIDNLHAYRLLGQKDLAERLVANGQSSNTGEPDDYENTLINYGQSAHSGGLQTQSSPQGPSSTVPKPKSPGFVVLANILSVSNSEILSGVLSVLADLVPTMSDGSGASRLAETYALFKNTPPTMTSAKQAGKKDFQVTNSMREKLLPGLRPNFQDPQSFSEAVSWQERSVVHALHILAAAAVREEAFYAAVTASPRQLQVVPIVRFDKPVASATEISVQRVHIARLFDRLATSRDIIPCLTRCIGYNSSSDDHDAFIAAGGLSVLFYIHQALQAPSRIETIVGSAPSGHKRLCIAVASRLKKSFERRGSESDSQMLALIVNWILTDCRRGGKATGLAHLLLGIGSPLGYTPRRESQDCCGVILEMVNLLSFVLNEETSDIAANCFEILVRVCDLNHVNDTASLRRALDAMERLRSVSFWRSKLEYFTIWRDTSYLEAPATPGLSNVIHSIAWILKGAALELHVLAGFSPPQGSRMDYIPPRPSNAVILADALFGANDDVVGNIVRKLPLHRLAVDAARSPPQDAIRAAEKPLDGSPEVTRGYSVVDEDVLLSRLSRLNNEHFPEYKRWASSWNQTAKIDCAVSHLSEVLRLVIGVSLPHFDGNSGTGLPLELLLMFLASALHRLEGLSEASQYSARATWNLSWVILMISQTVAAAADEAGDSMGDLKLIRDLLASSVKNSAPRINGSEASFHNERTAMLGASLTEIVQVMPHDESSWDVKLVLDVAEVLASVSAAVEVGNHGNSSGPTVRATQAAIIARRSLGALVMTFDQNVEAPIESLAHTFLSKKPSGERDKTVVPLLRLLSMQDLDIVPLFVQLVQIPFVGDLLIHEGLFKALEMAGDSYVRQEQQLLSSANGRNISIGFPPILHKHLEVFKALMSTAGQLSDDHVSALPQQFFAVLGRYRIAIERSFAEYTKFGEELCLLVQCWAHLGKLAPTGANNTLQVLPGAARLDYRDGDCERLILEMVLRISETPFPEDWSAEIPYSLALNDSLSTQTVQGYENSGPSWWQSSSLKSEKRNILLRNFDQWTEEMFAHAILATSLLKAGLLVLMESRLRNLRFELLLVRGMFRLYKAAELVQQDVEALFQPEHNFMQTDLSGLGGRGVLDSNTRLERLRELGPQLGTCAHRMLLALVSRVKIIKLETENRVTETWSRYFKAVDTLLQFTDLEAQGIPCILEKKEQNSVKQLTEALRALVPATGAG